MIQITIKKTLTIMLMITMLSLLTTSVMAISTTTQTGNQNNNIDNGYSNNNVDRLIQERSMEQLQTRTQLVGLDNAMLRVQNQSQQQLMEQDLDKIETNRRKVLNRLEGLIIQYDNTAIKQYEATGYIQSRFLNLFEVRKQLQYMITTEGDVIYQQGLFDRLFIYSEDIE